MDPPATRSSSERPLPRERDRIAATLRAVCITFLIVMGLLFGVTYLVFPKRPGTPGAELLLGVLALILLALWLLQRGRLRLAAHLLVWMTWSASTAGMIGAAYSVPASIFRAASTWSRSWRPACSSAVAWPSWCASRAR